MALQPTNNDDFQVVSSSIEMASEVGAVANVGAYDAAVLATTPRRGSQRQKYVFCLTNKTGCREK